jgi:hypothetical protein
MPLYSVHSSTFFPTIILGLILILLPLTMCGFYVNSPDNLGIEPADPVTFGS